MRRHVWQAYALTALTWSASAITPPHGDAQSTIRVRASTELTVNVRVDDAGKLEVRGRLVDDRGSPLAERSVSLVLANEDGKQTEVTRALTTHADGSFEMRLPAQPGTWEVTARHAGDASHGPAKHMGSIEVDAAPAAAPSPHEAVVKDPSVAWLAAALLLSALFALSGPRSQTRAIGRNAGGRGSSAPRFTPEPQSGPRERAAAAFRPAALAILPAADSWWHRTVRETLADPAARASEIQPETLASLSAAVEHACYGPAEPTDVEIAEIERISGAVVSSLDARR